VTVGAVDDTVVQKVRGIQVILAHCIDAEQGSDLSTKVIDHQVRVCTPPDLLGTGAMATALGTRELLEVVAAAAVDLVDTLRELSTSLDPMRRPTTIEDVVAAVWKRTESSGRNGSQLPAAS
jgi:hypothetical protein